MQKANNHDKDGIITRIINIKNNLPKKQKKLCNYMIEHYEHIGIMTVKELAEKANVGTTTVLRVTKKLNFNNFSELKKTLHEAAVNGDSKTWWHLKKSIENNSSVSSTTQVWEETINLLGKTMNDSFIRNFEEAVSLMLESKKINILGLRSSKVAAKYLEYLLKEISSKVNQISDDVEFLYDRLLQMEAKEVLIIFIHAPFTVQTIEAAKYCYEAGIKVILITNLMSCPITPYADIIVKVQASETQYTIVPTISLIEAMVIEYGRNTPEDSAKHLDILGQMLSEKEVTTSDNLNLNF